jgi:adenylate kinase
LTMEITLKPKKFVLIPRDAMELLLRRFAECGEATEAAASSCAEDGQTMYVVEMKAVAARADRPVKVTKL